MSAWEEKQIPKNDEFGEFSQNNGMGEAKTWGFRFFFGGGFKFFWGRKIRIFMMEKPHQDFFF